MPAAGLLVRTPAPRTGLRARSTTVLERAYEHREESLTLEFVTIK